MKLIDPYGRKMRKLRVSLTDACNYHCFYCMPDNIRFMPTNSLMKADEYFRIISRLVEAGIEELRITGGEPTLRRDFPDIMNKLSEIPDCLLGLTTNGQTLDKHLKLLESINCRKINVSLDSLDEHVFQKMTRNGNLKSVLTNLYKARDAGFQLKVNTVLFRGINDKEVLNFIRWSSREKIEVRFLEFMKIGPKYLQNTELFVSAAEVIKKLKQEFALYPVPVSKDSTSFVYRTDTGARIGFIASESHPFCSSCSRLRLSAQGNLRVCLMREDGVSLRNVPDDEISKLALKVLHLKPLERIDHMDQAMNSIGG